jgi:NADH:ubiquinone oxidoreductase subunit 2 (subunit N)
MLGTAGFSALVAAFTVVVSAAPPHAWWCCALAVIAAVIALRRSEGEKSSNPVVRHGVQSLEYVALAAVVPLAFWVMDVYGLVRDLSLP